MNKVTKIIDAETVSTSRAHEIKCPSCGKQLSWFYKKEELEGNAKCCNALFRIEPLSVIFSVHEPILKEEFA